MAVGGSIVGQLLVIYFPPLQHIFQTEALHFSGTALISIVILKPRYQKGIETELCLYSFVTLQWWIENFPKEGPQTRILRKIDSGYLFYIEMLTPPPLESTDALYVLILIMCNCVPCKYCHNTSNILPQLILL